MKINRRPYAWLVLGPQVRNRTPDPEGFNDYGYSALYRSGVAAVLAEGDKILAAGFNLMFAKAIGQKAGHDVPADADAMHPIPRAQWPALFPDWIAKKRRQYPGRLIGFYTGIGFEENGKLDADPNSPDYKFAIATNGAKNMAVFRGCHGLFLDLGVDMLCFDKAASVKAILAAVTTAKAAERGEVPGLPKAMIEALHPDYFGHVAQMARTEFFNTSSQLKDIGGTKVKVDPKKTEVHWLIQNEMNTAAGPGLKAEIKRIADNGIIPMCQWPFAAAEIAEVAAGHPNLTWGA